MSWGLVASAGASIVGGMMSGDAAEEQAEGQRQIDGQKMAMTAEQAAALKEASKWKATGTTNRYGASAMTVDPTTGAMTDATWQMSPEMKAYQDRLQAGAGVALPADFDINKATEEQYQLLKNQQAPGVERGYSGLLSNLMAKGTLGLSTGGTTGLGGGPALMQSNPQLEAYFNAIAQQDASNMTTAQTTARSLMDSDISRSGGLMSQVGAIEDRGLSSLDRTIRWSADQRDAAMRGAGAVATQSNLATSMTPDAEGGTSMWGELLQGLGSNKQLSSSVSGLFGTAANPNVPTTVTGMGAGSGFNASKVIW